MEKKVKTNELKLDSNQQAKVSKKKEIQNTIKAVEYSLKQGSKGAGRWVGALRYHGSSELYSL